MEQYKNNFKKYIHDLSAPQAHPGGGSCAALCVCLGISLIQMAFNYSLKKAQSTGIMRPPAALEKLKSEVFGVIDSDGEVFAKLLREKAPAKRKKLISRMQKEIMNVACGAGMAIRVSGRLKPSIKKSLLSDFRLGIRLCRTALYACSENLKANQSMFGAANSARIARVKKYLQESV